MKTSFSALTLLFVILLTGSYTYIKAGGSTSFKHQFLELINKTRTKGCTCGNTYMPPAPPLVWNDDLEISALGHAKDMAEHKYFSHTSKDGRSMDARIINAGYTFKGFKSFMAGENIAYGQTSINEVMTGWYKSEGHCRNLMNPGFKEVGVAEFNTYWVQDFGGREPFSAEQQKLIRSGKVKIIQGGPVRY